MHIEVFQHVPFEDSARMADWARERGHRVHTTRWFAGESPPPMADCDMLFVMGGLMGTYDEADYPWLAAVKRSLRDAIDAGIKIVGVCLGAQLLAEGLGGRVYPNPLGREIGWWPVQTTPAARGTVLFGPEPPTTVPAFQWHGDTFDLPPGATNLATSPAAAHQCFELDRRIVAMQFHWDYSAESIRRMHCHCSAELTDAPAIQPAEKHLPAEAELASTGKLLFAMLDRLAETG